MGFPVNLSFTHLCNSLFCPTDPAISIEAFGKAWKVQVVTISLGLPQQLSEAIRAIKDAIKDDNKWVLLQNCDLESEWSQDFLRLIEVTLILCSVLYFPT